MTSTNDHTATTDTTTPSAHDAAELVRAWTTVGQQLYDRERANREGHNYATGPDVVTAAIDTLDWRTLPPGGVGTLPFSPGEGIKGLIAEVGLTNVSRLAWNAAIDVRDDAEHARSLYSLYGIEAHHGKFPVRVFVVDRGTDLLIVAVDAPHELAIQLDPTAGVTPTH